MRVLITGVSGFLGWNLALHLRTERPDWELSGTNRTNECPEGVMVRALDLGDAGSIRDLLAWSQPDVVVHGAAMSKARDCEENPEKAMRLNAVAVRHFVENLNSEKTHFIYCSTDCVYDGLEAPYAEDIKPTPPHAYGRTKAAGEEEAAKYGGPVTIVRFALMFGLGPKANPSFLGWLDAGLRSEQGATMFSDEIRTALYGRDAARGLTAIMDRRATGIFHLGGPEAMARDEFALIYARVFGLDAKRVRSARLADNPSATYRAPNLALDIGKARRDLGFEPIRMEEALREIREMG